MRTPEDPNKQTKKVCATFRISVMAAWLIHFSLTHFLPTLSWVRCWFLTACFFPSCWLSLEGGLLYAFVGPAAAVVLVLTHPSPPLPRRLDPWLLTCALPGLWGSGQQQWQLPHPVPVTLLSP